MLKLTSTASSRSARRSLIWTGAVRFGRQGRYSLKAIAQGMFLIGTRRSIAPNSRSGPARLSTTRPMTSNRDR